MFSRTLTSRDFLKIQSCEQLLGLPPLSEEILSPEQRYAQAEFAQRHRNVWFTATGPSLAIESGGGTDAGVITAQNPTFSEPVVVAEMLQMMDWGNKSANLNTPTWLLQIREIGTEGANVSVGFFGLSTLVPGIFIVAHEKNRSQLIDAFAATGGYPDTQGKSLQFVPFLLKPYQRLKINWLQNINEPSSGVATFFFTPQLGFRGVRALRIDNPYAYIPKLGQRQIYNYIKGSEPETFLLEVQIPFASLPAVGKSATFKTDQQERPLLVLGATANLEGCQADLWDDSEYYQFTQIDKRLLRQTGFTEYLAPPLSLWAPDSDFRNANNYCMWPVPHLLDRNAQLRIVLTNGLLPNSAGAFQQVAATRGSQAARITFLCRTV